MSDPIDPLRGVGIGGNPTRRSGRDRRKAAEAEERADMSLPVPAGPVVTPEPETTPDAAFEAQLLGQDGQKRGLKGGKEVLEKARGAYLGTEYSGTADRRPSPGLIKKTEI